MYILYFQEEEEEDEDEDKEDEEEEEMLDFGNELQGEDHPFQIEL